MTGLAEPAQLTRCMREALDRAGIGPQDVAVVFASANSTQQLDRVEAAALTRSSAPERARHGAQGRTR